MSAVNFEYLDYADAEKRVERLEDRTLEQVQKAAQRYAESSDARETFQAEVEEKGILVAEDDARISLRESLPDPMDSFALERITGTNDLLPFNYLSRGSRVGCSVCRIHIRRPNGTPEGYGTGFMISPSLLMTNHHVLPTAQSASKSLAEFNYETDEDFTPRQSQYFQLEPERFFYNNEVLDFAIVAVSPESKSGSPLRDFKHLYLTERSGKALATEWVSLVQHPAGNEKHIAIRNNRLLYRFEDFIHFETDTQPGSSGSPIFNDQWDVVALHHAGVPRKMRNRVMKKDGTPWKSGESDELIDWIANEGIRISSIFAVLKDKDDWSWEEMTLLIELGAFSESDLGETMIESMGIALPETTQSGEQGVRVTTRPIAEPTPPPDVQPITFTELMDMVNDPNIQQEDLAPYFIPVEDITAGIDPSFQFNPELVIMDVPEMTESAQALNLANWACKRIRQQAYYRLDRQDRIRIISEGDSWFQYPFLLQDIIDHLMDFSDFAVLSFGEAGDLIANMVSKAEYAHELVTENPHFFLISGGGNDLVAGRGLQRYLINSPAGNDPRQYINHFAVADFKASIASHFTSLFRSIIDLKPDIQILCHGYSYPIPANGPWLGTPMAKLGITDAQTQEAIIRIIFDEVNEMLADTAAAFVGSVYFLDVRNVVPRDGWHDELHPTNRYYGAVAEVFRDKIDELS